MSADGDPLKLPLQMDILLVSGRGRGEEPHPSRERAASLTRELVRLGHSVRWLCPVRRGAHASVDRAGVDNAGAECPEGAVFQPVVTQARRFRAVEKGLADISTECALSREVRRQTPDVVHVLAHGGVSSTQLVWIADRLGAPVVASVSATEVLCHRGTLVDQTGASCRVWDDPVRCARCCAHSFAGGLSAGEAAWASCLRVLGPWSPYPGEVAFLNPRSIQRNFGIR